MNNWRLGNPPGDGTVVWGLYRCIDDRLYSIKMRKLDGIWVDFMTFFEVSAPAVWRNV